ncbi:hypothetical protein BASA81_003937 [Batrachochytrium salamandrivorans]|nr:hypothetical protein BASA81_003937 [Batrachochytrium salamandrivorans]
MTPEFWGNGELGERWQALAVSSPLFVAMLVYVLHSLFCRPSANSQQTSLGSISSLDKLRVLLCLLLCVIEPVLTLVALRHHQTHDYLDSLVWTSFPLLFLVGLILREATLGQRESLFFKLLAVGQFAVRLVVWGFHLQDDQDNKTQYYEFGYCVGTGLVMFLLACFARPVPRRRQHQGLHEPLLSDDENEEEIVSPEAEAGWFSILTFSWMSVIMSNERITMQDMFPLREEDSSAALKQRFADAMLAAKSHHQTLVRVLYTSGAITPFILAAPIKLVYDVLVFFAPSYLLRRFIEFIAQERLDTDPVWWKTSGCHLALALFAVAAFQTFILQYYFWLVFRAGMRVRASLVTVMYDKALRLSHAQQSQATANLVSTDAVSAAVSFGLIFAIVFGATKILSDKQKALNQILMKSKDVRVKKTLEMLNSIKLIKLYGMERIFKDSISLAREDELALLRRYVFLSTANKLVSGITPFVVLVSTLGTFVALGGELDPPTAFVSVTLLQLLRFPMNMLPNLLGGLIEGLNSLGRIDAYLNLEELVPQPLDLQGAHPGVAVHLAGSYLWAPGKPPALTEVNLTVREGEFCIVRGSVGSGKTALLLAVLGELDPDPNVPCTRYLNGTVSYAGQTPWIRNASIRDNILLGEAFEEDFYLQVLDAACLMPDLAQLASGDLTDIGEKGINLSGGQKARISLARCLYSRSDVLLLESVFEAVDEHVQGEIWKRAFFTLLRNERSKHGRKRTAIVVTHCVKPETRLVDSVVRMDKGRLTSVPVEEDMETKPQSRIQQEDSDGETNKPLPPPPRIATPLSLIRPLSAMDATATGKSLMSVETSTTTFGDNKAYALYIHAIGGWSVVLSQLLVASLRTANEVGSSRWLAHWSNQVERGEDRDLFYYLSIYSAFALVAVVMFATMFLSIYLASLKASYQLHAQLMDSIVRAPMAFFDSTPLGRITQRFTKDLNALDMVLPPIIITLYQVSFDAFGTVLVVAIVSPLFLFALPFMIIVYLKVKTIYVRTSRELKNLDSISLSPVFSQFSEASDGCVSIRAFGKTNEFKHQNFVKLDRNLSAYYLMTSANRWLAVRIEFIGNFLLLFASLLTASKHGTVSAAMAGMALAYTMNITQSLNWVVRTLGEFETNIVSVERVNEYANEIPQEMNDGKEVSLTWPEHGEIVFDNVSVRYRPELEDVLKEISFTIPPGAHVGCVGQTGCGKSTLLLALLRIVEPNHGRVLIDGVDSKGVDLERLRNAMSIIPQDAVMFQNTLRFNLDPSGLKSDTELWRVLDSCELSEFVKTTFTTGSLDQVVSGNEFSFGQRQLFCIARALLRNTKILLSDEASSGIDRATDAKLRKMIQTEFASVTTLTIAHRLETIASSDLVLVLDFGRVVEFDSPTSLLANPQSKFALLVNEMNKNTKA